MENNNLGNSVAPNPETINNTDRPLESVAQKTEPVVEQSTQPIVETVQPQEESIASPEVSAEPVISETSPESTAPVFSEESVTPAADVSVENSTIPSEISNVSQPQTQQAQEPVAEASKKKHKTGIIVIILVILLLLGGGFLAFYFLVLQGGITNKNDAISNFIDTAFYASGIDTTTPPKNQSLSMSGKITLESEFFGEANIKLDGEMGGGNFVFNTEPKFSIGDETVNVGKISLLSNSGAIYLKTNNINPSIIPVFGENLSPIFESMNDNWYEISLSDTSDMFSLLGDGTMEIAASGNDTCLKQAIFNFLKTIKPDFIAKRIITLSDYEGSLKPENGTLYFANLDSGAFAEFLKESSKKIPANEIVACMGSDEEVDPSEYIIDDETAEEMKKQVADFPDFIVEINNSTEITRVYFDSSLGDFNIKADIKITYPESVKTEKPEDAKPFKEVVKKIEDLIYEMFNIDSVDEDNLSVDTNSSWEE